MFCYPHTSDKHRSQLLKDFNAFARRMRLQYIFHGKDKEQHPFHVKSDWEPPVQPSVALETYLEEVKLQLANINTITPRNNLPKREQLAIKQLKQNPDINIKRADKGSSIVVLNKEDKIKEGQIQLDDRENYKPLETPMVVETSKRVKKLIDKLYKEKHIDEMTRRWLSLTPNSTSNTTTLSQRFTNQHQLEDRSYRAAKARRKESHHLLIVSSNQLLNR